MQVSVPLRNRGGAGPLFAIVAALALAVPAEAPATLPGPNGLIWTQAESEPNRPVTYFGTYDLATESIRKTNIERLIGQTFLREVSFSGDGSLVAFPRASGSSGGIGTGSHIAVLPTSGGVPVDLTPDSTVGNYGPSFCGDGTIVFQRGGSIGPAEPGKVKSTLWAVSSAGGAARQLTTGGTPPATAQEGDKGSDMRPSCSQDGTIVFFRDGQIMKTTLAGGTPTVLQTDADSFTSPDMSPDGTRFVYDGRLPNSQPGQPGTSPMIAPIAGGPAQAVAGIGTDGGFAQQAQWSPDGKQLIYERNIRLQTNRLYTLDLASSTETLQTTDPYAAQFLAWSPSMLTPMITTTPTYPVPTPTPTTSPAPTQPSAAAVLAALKSVGRLPKNTTVAKLLAGNGAVVPFGAPSAGLLSVTWTSSGGAIASAKRAPLARARKTFTAAGKAKVKIKLTTAGRKAIKRAKRAVKIVSRASFTPAGGTKTSKTTRFKIRK